MDRLCPFSGPQCLTSGWFIGSMITCGPLRPRTPSSYPQTQKSGTFLTRIMRAGVLGQETKSVPGGGVRNSIQIVVTSDRAPQDTAPQDPAVLGPPGSRELEPSKGEQDKERISTEEGHRLLPAQIRPAAGIKLGTNSAQPTGWLGPCPASPSLRFNFIFLGHPVIGCLKSW